MRALSGDDKVFEVSEVMRTEPEDAGAEALGLDGLPDDDPLGRAFRIVRRLTAEDAPYPGALAREGDSAVVLVDHWDATVLMLAASGSTPHLYRPKDVARTADGHALIYPWCHSRVTEFIEREDGGRLSEGEAVTLALSLHRGLRALASARRSGSPHGQWWITDDGCPVFAVCEGLPIEEETASLWRRLGDACQPGSVRDLLQQHNGEDDIEEALGTFAAPMPLNLGTRPVRKAALSASRDVWEYAPERASSFWDRCTESLRALLSRHLDTDIAKTVSAAMRSLQPRREHTAAKSRGARMPLIIAGSVAMLVVIVGLLWPSGDGESARGVPDPAPDASASRAQHDVYQPESNAASDAAPDDAEASTSMEVRDEGVDAVGELEDILIALGECADDVSCARFFEKPEDRATRDAAYELRRKPVSVQLLDDLGGVMLLDVTSTTEPDERHVVVLTAHEGTWVIREVSALGDTTR